MTSRRETGLYQLFITTQLVIVLLTYMVCLLAVLIGYHGDPIPPIPYSKYLLVLLTALLFESLARPGFLRSQTSQSRRVLWRVTVRQWFAMAVALLVLLVFSRDLRISRIFLGVFMLSSGLVLFATNRGGFRILTRLLAQNAESWALRALILGPPDWCESVQSQLRGAGDTLRIVGVEEISETTSAEEIHRRLDGKEIDLLIVSAYYLTPEVSASMIRRGERNGFRTWMPVELSRRLGRRFNVERVGGMDLLTPPSEPLENTLNSVIKRCFDFAVSGLVAALVLPPLMLLVWILQRCFSPGPLFFMQDRVGVNNSIFRILKFRTMDLDNDDESRQVTAEDERVYFGARLLRKLSLDEFPQFLNVLRGHMSIVGPRPHMVSHEQQFQRYFERYGIRRYVKPGITGLAQIRGFRGEVTGKKDIRGRARYDVLYVRRWSFLLDLRLIAATVLFVVKPHRTAY